MKHIILGEKEGGEEKGEDRKGKGSCAPMEVSQVCLGLEGIVVIHCYR